MSLLFITLSRFFHSFPSKKEVSFNFIAAVTVQVILEPKKVKSVTASTSVQFSHSVMSNSLWPHGPQQTRPPCPTPIPRVHPNSCPLSWWHYPTISSSVIPFYPCSQSFQSSGFFQMSQLFESGSQSIGVSSSASVLPMNTQDWSPLG